jgi:hypothetical protein
MLGIILQRRHLSSSSWLVVMVCGGFLVLRGRFQYWERQRAQRRGIRANLWGQEWPQRVQVLMLIMGKFYSLNEYYCNMGKGW